MALTDEIAIKLGIQTGDLKAALADANASIRQFKDTGKSEPGGLEDNVKGIQKSLRQLKEFFAAGGIIQAVKGFFEMAIANARDTKGAVDENFEAVRRFGDGVDSTVSTLKNWATEALGFVNRVGEAYGSLINRVRGVSAEQEKIRLQIASDADAAEARLAKSREENSPEKIAAANEKLAAVLRKNQEEQLEGQAKINAMNEDYNRLVDQALELGKGTVAYREKLIELATLAGKIDKEQAEVNKAAAADQAKAIDQKLHDFFDEIDAIQTITDKTHEQADAQGSVTEAVEETTSAIESEAAAAAKAHAAFIVQKQQEANAIMSLVGIGSSANQLGTASDDELKELIRRDQEAAKNIPYIIAGSGIGESLASSMERARLQAEAVNAQKELDFRASLRNAGSEDIARRMFEGNPLVFDDVYNQFRSGDGSQSKSQFLADQSQKQLDVSHAILKTLSNVVGSKYAVQVTNGN